MQNIGPEYYRLLNSIVEDAQAFDGEALGEFLDQRCDNPQLRQDVEELIRSLHTLPLETDAAYQIDEALLFDTERYVREEVIGTGGRGKVWRAFDQQLKRDVAIKEMKQTVHELPAVEGRLMRECRITGRLDHPGVVPVYGMGRGSDGEIFYAMRLIEGETLQQAIDRFHTSDTPQWSSTHFRQLVHGLIRICSTIQYAHNRGIVHRDLKPKNIMLGQYGDTQVVDWGLAKDLTEARQKINGSEESFGQATGATGDSTTNSTPTGSIVGTPRFMSPEQAAGNIEDVTFRSDIYGLGAILYTLLTGQPPFRNEKGSQLLYSVRNGLQRRPREIISTVPHALEFICRKAMSKAPSDRFNSAEEMADQLDNWLKNKPVDEFREPMSVRLKRTARRHTEWIRVGLVAMLLVTAVSVVAMVSVLRAQKASAAADQARIESQVQAFLTSDPTSAAAILDQLRLVPNQTSPIIDELQLTPLPKQQRARLQLIQASATKADTERLVDSLTNASIDEIGLIAVSLKQTSDLLTPELWKRLDGHFPQGQRLRAAASLAILDPSSKKWPQHADRITADLTNQEAFNAARWALQLEPVADSLCPSLIQTVENSGDPEKRRLASRIVIGFASTNRRHLTDLLLVVDRDHFKSVFDMANPKAIRDKLEETIEQQQEVDSTKISDEDEANWRRTANVAIGLLRLGHLNKARPLLVNLKTPSVCSRIIDQAVINGLDRKTIIQWIRKEHSTTNDPLLIHSLLLMAAGSQTPNDSTECEIDEASKKFIERLFSEHPDPGVHSACQLALQTFAIEVPETAQADGSASTLETSGDQSKRTWRINSQGQTLVSVPKSPAFRMGSPSSERNRTGLEHQHVRKIDRLFEIATTEVTRKQFASFLLDHPTTRYTYENMAPVSDAAWNYLTDSHPQFNVNWYDAANYCNWLSQQESIPHEEWCFIPNMDGEYGPGMSLAPDYLNRLGYRLPTEAEWEFAARAATTTPRYFGNDRQLLPRYAKYQIQPEQNRPLPVASLLPNSFGLFDTLGNLDELCLSRYRDYRLDCEKNVVHDVEDLEYLNNQTNRVMRGGSFTGACGMARAANRAHIPPNLRYPSVGFRIARTVTATPPLTTAALRQRIVKNFATRRFRSTLSALDKFPNIESDTNLLIIRGASHAELGEKIQAQDDFTKANILKHWNGDSWYFSAVLHLHQNERAEFDSLSETMLARTQSIFNQKFSLKGSMSYNINFLVRPVLIRPKPGQTFDPVIDAINRIKHATPDDPAFEGWLGVALFRAGRFQTAIETITSALSKNHRSTKPVQTLFLAMATAETGDLPAAKLHLKEARALIKYARREQGADRWIKWQHSMEFEIVAKEAEKMIGDCE